MTGRCNIECRFCGYTRDVGRSKFTEPVQVSRLDFLRFVQGFRLNSGLGEPTLNKDLPTIIAEMTLAACREQYDEVYGRTVHEAETHHVSLEIPFPSDQVRIAFGLEVRSFYDFARIETNEWTLGRFLNGLQFDKPVGSHCHFLWRQGAIGSTNNAGHSTDESHYMYPCLGPLSGVDLSRTTPVRFPDAKGYVTPWQGHCSRICARLNTDKVCVTSVMYAGRMIRVTQRGLLSWKILLAGSPSSLAVLHLKVR